MELKAVYIGIMTFTMFWTLNIGENYLSWFSKKVLKFTSGKTAGAKTDLKHEEESVWVVLRHVTAVRVPAADFF